jgi:hypothetical protein
MTIGGIESDSLGGTEDFRSTGPGYLLQKGPYLYIDAVIAVMPDGHTTTSVQHLTVAVLEVDYDCSFTVQLTP